LREDALPAAAAPAVRGPQHPALAHHFDNLDQQAEAATLGMWVFLLTEVLFFGGAFLVYTVYRHMYHDAFVVASHSLDIVLGTINTAVLIGSSLTMALAVRAAQVGSRRLIQIFLILTIVLGCVFLGIKATEYLHKFHEHHVPGQGFQFEATYLREAQIFFSLYFVMTGLHALHMIIGIVVMLVILWQASRGAFSAEYFVPVEVIGLYWHFVDIVWIFLFPLLYLIGRHGVA
jgi:cytochrome c oxidase subunit III